MTCIATLLAGAWLLAVSTATPAGGRESLVALDTRPGVQQRILLALPETPVAAVILFAGGHGALRLEERTIGWGGSNFLVRSRSLFRQQGILTAVIDAPSDRQGNVGMLGGFRAGPEHCQDVAAVVKHLRTVADVPVWLVGTSRGTESAANCAVRLNGRIGGVVLLSSVSRPNRHGVPVLDMELGKITVPAMVVAHEADGCEVSPSGDAPRILQALGNASRRELRVMRGGGRALTEPCQARSPHGFLGIEEQTVSAIADFIKRR